MRWGVGVVVGVVVGALTAQAQGWLPVGVGPLANSGAPWALVAVVLVWAVRATGGAAAGLGAVTLVAEVIGYYGVAGVHGFASSPRFIAFWLVAALVVGPIAGLAGGALRSADERRRLAGLAVPCGILLGEGLYLALLVGRAELRPYGIGSAVLGGLLAVAGIVTLARRTGNRALGLLGTVLVGAVLLLVEGAAGYVL